MREVEVPVLNGAQRRHGLHGLTPEGRFIAVQSFKRATVEMGAPQKTVRQDAGRVDGILG